jgi:flap endonuclease-1
MGVQLTELVKAREIEFNTLAGKKVAIDAMNSLYQFLSIIRQPDGTPLMDSEGRITSHLSGLFYRNVNLIEYGIKPIYVFDGQPPKLKESVMEERTEIRITAQQKWKEALAEGRLEDARVYAQQSSRFTEEMLEDSKRLLGYMGIPVVQAPSEGEAQAAYMAAKGDAWATGSQDFDSLLFGSPRLARNLTISGKRKIPRKKAYIEIKPEVISLDETLRELEITREQLVDLAILVGTDYNPKGIEGIGPKKAYSLIKEFGDARTVLEEKGFSASFDLDEIRSLFLNPEVTDKYTVEWNMPDSDEIVDFLCHERDFSISRVKKALEKLEASSREARSQSSLEKWF